MSLHPRFHDAVRYLHPTVNFLSDVIVRDDGDGTYVAEWNLPGSPPTDVEIDAAITQIDADVVDRRREAQLAALVALEAIFKALFNHENRIRSLAGQAQITATQFRAGIKALLD